MPDVSLWSLLDGVALGDAMLLCAVSVSATPRLCLIPLDSESSARKVAHVAMFACVTSPFLTSSGTCPRFSASFARGVAHEAICATTDRGAE
jgi:hypothetical protein